MRKFSFLNTVVVLVCGMLVAVQLWAPPASAVNSSDDSGANAQFDVRATATPAGVLVEWASSFDPNILGFNVHRVLNGSREKINGTLIAGPTLVSGPRTPTYAWFDASGTSASEYEVEWIDVRGEASRQVHAVHAYTGVLPQYRQSETLDQLGGRRPSQIANPDWDETKAEISRSAPSAAGDSPSSALAQQWVIANQRALKIGVRSDGWYRVTQAQMAAAGFDVNGDARNLQLWAEGIEQAIKVSRDSGALSSSDFLEFWGRSFDTPTTDTRVYWLINGGQPGKRINTVGEVQPTETSVAVGTSINSAPNLIGALSIWLPFLRPNPTAVTNETRSRNEIAPSFRNPSASEISNLRSQNSMTVPPAPPEVKDSLAKPVVKHASDGKDESAAPLVSSDPEGTPKRKVAVLSVAPASTSTVTSHKLATLRSSVRSRPKRRHRRAKPLRVRHHSVSAAVEPAFSYVAEYKERSVYYTAALNGDRENFFGPVIFGQGAGITLNLRNIERTSTTPVQLQVSLQGVSLGLHQLNVVVDGTPAGLVTWLDQGSTIRTFSIPAAWLIEGDNHQIKFVPLTPTNDTSVLDYARVTYTHSFRADNDYLQFSIKATQTACIDGFTTGNIRIVDVTDPNSIQEVRPIVETSGNGFTATVPGGDRGKARRLIALPASRISQPAWIALNEPSTLNGNTNAADLVIISYRDFIPSLATLVTQRQAQGFTVKVVDVDDVFDEFSFGEHTPQAIRDFMSLAKNNWTRAPSYLLLAGDASYDSRNYLGSGNFDFVPTKLLDTGTAGAATALEAASDDWLTDFDGNGIADIPVGRLPLRTVADANLVVSKIVNYSPANTGNRALLVADTQGSYYFNFEAANDQIAGTLPAPMTIQKVYRRLQPSDADARSNIIAGLNAGQSVTVYSGHGNVNTWAVSVFTANDASALTNGNRLSLVVVMDCLNGYFDDPTLKSLAESLILAPNGGAVASFASSGLTFPDGQHEMGLRMFQLLYGGSPIAIGDASSQAKAATSDMDVRRTWILLGDPTLKIR